MPAPRNIHHALSLAQAKVKAAYKSGDNKFDRYQYAKLEDFMEAAKPIMADLGLSLVCSVVELIPLDPRKTKAGGEEHAVRVKLQGQLHWTDGEKSQTIECFSYGEGQDRADKAIYKAITGGKKYLIAGLFQIPTTDDPEADETVGTATPAPVRAPENPLAAAFKQATALGMSKAGLLEIATGACGYPVAGAADIKAEDVAKVICAWGFK